MGGVENTAFGDGELNNDVFGREKVGVSGNPVLDSASEKKACLGPGRRATAREEEIEWTRTPASVVLAVRHGSARA